MATLDRAYFEKYLNETENKTLNWQYFASLVLGGGATGYGLGCFASSKTLPGKLFGLAVTYAGTFIEFQTIEDFTKRHMLKKIINDLDIKETEEMLS